MKQYIDDCITFQEACGLEILVHGEPERNDMVEYFGEQLDGLRFFTERLGTELRKPLCQATVYLRRYFSSKTYDC